jgi:twitching motility protein PilT
MKLIKDLVFSDLYIRLDGWGLPHYRPTARKTEEIKNVYLDEDYFKDVKMLETEIVKRGIKNGDDLIIHNDIRYRVSKQIMSNGEVWCSLRKIAEEVPELDALGMDAALLPILKQAGRRTGLLVLAGATGNGKTTTSFALLNHYLKTYGDLAFTIEDPVEYNLEGRRGDSGYCFQMEVKDDNEWSEAVKTALRWHPYYIVVGEIRTPEAAAQLLRAACSGHLVITTIHAGSIEETIMSLIQLSEMNMGKRGQQLLADGLIGIVYQELLNSNLSTQCVFTEEGNVGDPVRSLIRSGKVSMLGSQIEQQQIRMEQGQFSVHKTLF